MGLLASNSNKMRIPVERLPVKVNPDSKRVIARFFFNGQERSKQLVTHLMAIEEDQVFGLLSATLQEYSKRHRNITKIWQANFDRVKKLKILSALEIDERKITPHRKMLIGSYFTHEYSIESAAFFNPSIVEDPDQSELEEGEKRLIISFRAVGEGHISSIVFRRALLDKDNKIRVLPVGTHVELPEAIHNSLYNKKRFLDRAASSGIDPEILKLVEQQLDDKFEYVTLRNVLRDIRKQADNDVDKAYCERLLWLLDSFYELSFSLDTDIAERVIYPFSELEKNGIEDARFVKFVNDDGAVKYYATYTAYDGTAILPKLLETKDFYEFKMRPLNGNGALNKNLALFPRKINGYYAMLSRIDGCNNYIMYSKNIHVWENPILLQSPQFPWEFVQMGNCGSPIETEHGWLMITHGVGPMRRYCLGASLLKLDDPSVEIGRLREPLLVPNEEEREGYVPNVVYSCGSIINGDKLIIPYAMSDYSSTFASVDIKMLLEKLTQTSSL